MLPQGFTRVEYIESTGEQYIDTGFKHNQNTRVRLVTQLTETPTENVWLFEGRNATGTSGASKSVFYYAASTRLWTTDYYGSSDRLNFPGINATDLLEIDYNKNVCTINGIVKTHNIVEFQSNYPLYLLADNRAGKATGPAPAKVWEGQIYDNGQQIRDYIPFIDASGDANLWDNVNNSAADKTGTFIHGAAVVPAALTGLSQIDSNIGIVLSWNASRDANEYIIFRDDIQIDAVYGDTTSYKDASVGLGEKHEYTVIPYNGTQPGTGATINAESSLPGAPENVTATMRDETIIITWDKVNGADGYIVYRDNDAISEVDGTEYVDSNYPTPSAVLYSVSTRAGNGESVPSISVRVEAWGTHAPNLIFDRTSSDVAIAKAMIEKMLSVGALTDDERKEWDKGLRGCYNASDINRVQYHVRKLVAELNTMGYHLSLNPRLTAKSDIMRFSNVKVYLENIQQIIDAFGSFLGMPTVPPVGNWIDYNSANDIEKILYVTGYLLDGVLSMKRISGTFTAGQDTHAQIIRRS